MDIVSTLLDAPGTYVGLVQDFDGQEGQRSSSARILITPLPRRTGVTIDYETFSTDGRPHVEHTMLGRLPDGNVMVIAHSHGDTVIVLHESEPGRFVDRDGTSPFPVEILIELPEPGRIVHHWRYGRPGDAVEDRDVADVRLVD